MGYTWEGWALDPDALLAELRTPSIDPAGIRFDPLDAVLALTHQRWAEVSRIVADALAGGGGDLGGDLANYVVLVTRTLGTAAGSVGHTSSGGKWFRDELFGAEVAAVVGRETALHLLVRGLGGLTLLDGPMLGWLDAEQCRAAAERVATFEPDDNTTEDLWSVFDALGIAARRGSGLVNLYV